MMTILLDRKLIEDTPEAVSAINEGLSQIRREKFEERQRKKILKG